MSWKCAQASSTPTGTVKLCSRSMSSCLLVVGRPGPGPPGGVHPSGPGVSGARGLQHRATREHGREVSAVVAVAVQVARRVSTVGGLVGSRPYAVLGGGRAGQGALR